MEDVEKGMPKYCNAMLARTEKDKSFMLMPSDFKGAFAYWVAAQNPNSDVKVVDEALEAWASYVQFLFKKPEVPQDFTYYKLEFIVTEHVFFAIPAIRALNEMEPDFIDLGALARNVFFMIIRQTILE